MWRKAVFSGSSAGLSRLWIFFLRKFLIPELAVVQGVRGGELLPLVWSQQWEDVVNHVTQKAEAETETKKSVGQTFSEGVHEESDEEQSLRGNVGFGVFLYQLPLRVDREYSVEGNAHLFI